MADDTIGAQQRILEDIKANGEKNIDARGNEHKGLIEMLYANKMMTADMKTDVVKAVEETAAAQVAEQEANDAADKALQEKQNSIAKEQLGGLKTLGNVFTSNLSDLKDGLKQDFDLLTIGFTNLSTQPGIRSIISILNFVGAMMGKMLFALVAGKFFKGLTAMQDGQIDMAETMKNIGGWAKGLVGMGPKIDRATGEEKEDQRSMVGKGFDKAKAMATELGNTVSDKITDTKDAMGKFFLPLTEGFNKLKEQGDEMRSAMGEKVSEFFQPMKDMFSEMSTNAKDKLGSIRENLSNWYKNKKEGVGTWLKDQAGALKDGIKQSKAYGLLTKAGKFLVGAMRKVGQTIMRAIVTPIIAALAPFVAAAVAFVASLIASAVAMLIPVLPIIAIIALIVLVAVGWVMLGMYIAKNWETIKEKFSIAMEQLGIWADKAVLWISNLLAPIRDKIGMFFASIMDSLASVINGAIGFINDMQPDWLRKIRGGEDLIDFRMSEGNVEAAEAAAAFRASEREAAGADIAARESALADRRAALAGDGDGKVSNNQQNNNTVVNNKNATTVVASRQEPTDRYAGMSAMAQ